MNATSQPIEPKTKASPSSPPTPPRLLDEVLSRARQVFPLEETAQRYADWTRQYILFHDKRHPRELRVAEVDRFLAHLANVEEPGNRLEDARSALAFPYGEVLHIDLGELPSPRPKQVLEQIRASARVKHL